MGDYFDAFELGPVPAPGPDAVSPGIYRGIYGMPMFVTVPTSDLAVSVDFWLRGLGFVDLFTILGRMTHLRRWAFQDVLLVSSGTGEVPALSVSFACVLGEIESIAQACEDVAPGCTTGPGPTPWNTVDLQVVTPENTRVVLTAARPWEPGSEQARALGAVGISPGRAAEDGEAAGTAETAGAAEGRADIPGGTAATGLTPER